MGQNRQYDWSARAAAQIVNLGYLLDGQSKSMQFQKIASLIHEAMRLADQEAREAMLKPSDN